MERTKTGISGFDKMFTDGIPAQGTMLISGSPGSGKTIFCLQSLIEGAKNNEKGLYISFEQDAEELIHQAERFGWDVNTLQKKGLLVFHSFSVDEIGHDIMFRVKELIKKSGASRVVIDSITTLNVLAGGFDGERPTQEAQLRYFTYKFIGGIKQLGALVLLPNQLSGDEWMEKDSVAEFAVDCIVVLKFLGAAGESSRTISIKKARQTEFDENIHPLEIGKEGIKVLEAEKIDFKFK